MKQITAFLLMLSIAAFAGEKTQHDHSGHMHNENAQENQMNCELEDGEAHTSVNLPTIQCGMCVKTISKALTAVEGVNMANVDLKAKTAHIHFATDKLNVEKIEKTITAAGYDANDKKRNEDAHAKLPQCCQSER